MLAPLIGEQEDAQPLILKVTGSVGLSVLHPEYVIHCGRSEFTYCDWASVGLGSTGARMPAGELRLGIGPEEFSVMVAAGEGLPYLIVVPLVTVRNSA